MNQPATAQLGRSKSGMKIGVKVLNLDRSLFSGFTTKNVVENKDIPGFYSVDGGVVVPDAGGYLIWGTKTKEYAEAPIEPAPPLQPLPAPVDLQPILTAILAAVATLKNEMANIPATVQAEFAQDRRAAIAELAKQPKAAEPVTLESLAKRLEAAETKNAKLTTAFSRFIASLEGKGIG